MYVTEESEVVDGVVYYLRAWVCCDNVWTNKIKWDDLEALGNCPICPDCGGYDGTIFI